MENLQVELRVYLDCCSYIW